MIKPTDFFSKEEVEKLVSLEEYYERMARMDKNAKEKEKFSNKVEELNKEYYDNK